MKRKTMKRSAKKRLMPIFLTFAMTASYTGGVFANEAPVKVGEEDGIMPMFADYGEASQSYEPWVHGYRYVDLLNYNPETDPYAEEMRATIPLQSRNGTFPATQANTWLEDKAQLYVMSASNYRNTGAEIWNGNASYDDFSYAPFMYWQYANITGTGGRPTSGMHRDIETGYGVEYGPVCIPMAAATNVAHRNGVLSLGEFFIDASWRGGQFIEEFIYKDEDGRYPYAEKMLEIMEYCGFDGYFINLEASIDAGYVDTFREILKWMRDQGAYIQWYDSTLDDGRTSYQNAFNDYNKNWVKNDKQGQVSDAIFLNYGYGNWNGDMTQDVEARKGVLKAAHEKAKELELDPYKTVFMGVEGDLWRLSADFDEGTLLQWGDGNFNSGYPKAVDENGQPYTSFAVWASDFYQKDYHDGGQFDVGYQWEAEERARMYYNSRTENSGDYSAVERPDINFDLSSQQQSGLQQPVFKGFSKYVVEKSVVNGTVFASDFNNGHGMQYWREGVVSRNMQWTNYGLQDILPTWQWWVEADGGIPVSGTVFSGIRDIADAVQELTAATEAPAGGLDAGTGTAPDNEAEAGSEESGITDNGTENETGNDADSNIIGKSGNRNKLKTVSENGSAESSEGESTEGVTPSEEGSSEGSESVTPSEEGSTEGVTPSEEGSSEGSEGVTPSEEGSSEGSEGVTPSEEGSSEGSEGMTPSEEGSTEGSEGVNPSGNGSLDVFSVINGEAVDGEMASFSAQAADSLLELDWDYGPEFYRLNNKTGESDPFPYTQIGAYNGGSSLVIYGDLTGGQVVNLYKTKLQILDGSTISLTYNKPGADDDSCMYAVLSLEDGEDVEKVYLPIEGSGRHTEGWKTADLDLSAYAGRVIASVGLGFAPVETTVSGYQVNLGRLVISDNENYSPAVPSGLHLTYHFDATDEIQIAWDAEEFGDVQNYHVYAVYADGSERFVGGGFGSNYYIKNMENKSNVTALRVYAVGRDGSRSVPAEISLLSSDERLSNVRASSMNGRLNVTWDDPAVIYKGDTVEVALEWQGTDKENPAPVVVAAGTGRADFDIPVEDGSSYILTFTVTRLGERQEPVNYFNMIEDNYSAPYDGEARKMPTAGNYYLLTTPSADDWRAMLVETSTGTKRYTRFSEVTTSWGSFAGDFAKYIPIAESGSDFLTIRVEDIDFNVSDPVTIQFQDGKPVTGDSAFGDELFPDANLRKAVREQVGENYDALSGFNGTLDLSGTDVVDLTGLNYLGSMKGLNLENCKKLVTVDMSPYPGVTVNVKGCSNLENLYLLGTQQTSLDIRGVNKLREFDISDSQISVLEADEANTYTNAFNWKWDNARLDLSDGTPESRLKEGMEDYFASGNVTGDYSKREAELFRYDPLYAQYIGNFWLCYKLTTPGKITGIGYTNGYRSYGSGYDLRQFELCTTSDNDITDSPDWAGWQKESFDGPDQETVELKLDTPTNAKWFGIWATKAGADDLFPGIRNLVIKGYPYLEGVFTYSGQKPVMDIAIDNGADAMVVEKDGKEYQLLDLLKGSPEAGDTGNTSAGEFGAVTNRGTSASDLIGLDWVDQKYLAGYTVPLEAVKVDITGADGAAYIHPERPTLGAISSEALSVDGAKAIANAEVNEEEVAANLFDGNTGTKWCAEGTSGWVGFELAKSEVVGEWYVLHAGSEGVGYITRDYALQTLKTEYEEAYLAGDDAVKREYLEQDDKWENLDAVSGNTVNSPTRQIAVNSLKSAQVYRFKVNQPEQSVEGNKAIRIYELKMYAYEGDVKGIGSNGYFKADKAGAYYVEYLRPGNVEDNVIARTTIIVKGDGPAELPVCTLTFETNGGSAVKDISRSFGEIIDLSGCVTSREGYNFTGWYSDRELTEKVTEIALKGNKTVYAGWKKNTVPPVETPKPTASAEPVETPKPTASAEPVETPKPTASAGPVETPKPTASAEPVETPKPTASAEPVETPKPVSDGWLTEEDGSQYWYEGGVKQGTEGRGKEIYDPKSDAWYWLDSINGGSKAVNKDVYIESVAGIWAENADGAGKWVRYDADGHMVKGWDSTEAGTWYFDPIYGTMAKGYVMIEGELYFFDHITGIGTGQHCGWSTVFGWVIMEDGNCYWYEDGVKQGTEGRGKEIYDPVSDAWYWLDAVDDGKKAVSKDVYMESAAGDWAENPDGTGKWVRYDANGRMVKGWNTTDDGIWYFDPIYGTMAKGTVIIEGSEYRFDAVTGAQIGKRNRRAEVGHKN